MLKKIDKLRRRGGAKEMPEEAWRVRLREAIKRSGKPMYQVSLEADLGKTYVSELFRKKKEPTIGPLQRICSVLGVTTASILEGIELTPNTERIVKIVSLMTPEEQEAWFLLMKRSRAE
jgi:transcriptional regulator with XRE-family HTH domain